MIVLLDESFPLGLLAALQGDGVSVEHIITLGWRGASDAQIRVRLQDPQVLFLTQDEDFLFGLSGGAAKAACRAHQPSLTCSERELWLAGHAKVTKDFQPVIAPASSRLRTIVNKQFPLRWRGNASRQSTVPV